MTKPAANVPDVPLEERAEMTLKAALEKVIVEHARRGLPMHIGRDDSVVELSGEQLRAEADRWKRKRPKKLPFMRTLRARLPMLTYFRKVD
jgi:hypothetical protein